MPVSCTGYYIMLELKLETNPYFFQRISILYAEYQLIMKYLPYALFSMSFSQLLPP